MVKSNPVPRGQETGFLLKTSWQHIYGIGSPTVRQAIDRLARKDILYRRRGSGTYVAEPQEKRNLFFLADTVTFFRISTRPPEVILLVLSHLLPVAMGASNSFNGSDAIFLSRLIIVKNIPVLVEDIYLHPWLFSGLEEISLSGKFLSRVLEDTFHFTLTGGTQHFSINYPD